MTIYDFSSYRRFIKEKLESYPKKGYGQSKRLAEYTLVSTAFISQVLAEVRHLTSDQAYLTAEFLGLSTLESRYFLKLLEFEKAGNSRHKKFLQKEIDEIKIQSQKVSYRMDSQRVLKDEEKAVFYSDWYYSAIRMFCSIKPQSMDSIIEFLGLPRKVTNDAIQFLLQAGLIITEGENYKIGPLSTHVDNESPWVSLHHWNWRKKAAEQTRFPHHCKVHFTSPMTLSKKDAEKIHNKLLKMIEEIRGIVDLSPAEEFYCLNMDWFEVRNTETHG